ncbi:hypothetical protein MG293_018373 [Ovis ammon polii]|uniref:Uncharacterized protein n=1 Tax=Ovis ammon polii TaxID=230172 RepID=A0AAD4TT92_OVIAM|nr:hypothetical protein MG293_018373 [Ovis ammon polii]
MNQTVGVRRYDHRPGCSLIVAEIAHLGERWTEDLKVPDSIGDFGKIDNHSIQVYPFSALVQRLICTKTDGNASNQSNTLLHKNVIHVNAEAQTALPPGPRTAGNAGNTTEINKMNIMRKRDTLTDRNIQVDAGFIKSCH